MRKIMVLLTCIVLLSLTGQLLGDGWSIRASCPGARRYAGGCAVQYEEAGTTATYIYVIGGDNFGMGGGLTNTNYRYSPLTNTWSTMAILPFSGYDFGVESGIRDDTVRLYLFGGYDGGYKSQIYEYTPLRNTWQVRRSMSSTREGMIQIGKIGGKLYAIGGDNGTPLTLNEEYDPATNGLTTMLAETAPRVDQAVVSVGDSTIFCIGGAYDLTWSYTSRSNYMFRPSGNSWTTKSFRSDSACGAVGAYFDDIIYVFSGGNLVHYLTAVERYRVSTDSWISNGPIMVVQDGAVCGVVPSNLYRPTVFNLLTPDSGATVATLQPTLTWENSDRTKGPRIWVITGGTDGSTPTSRNAAYTITSDTLSANDSLFYTLFYSLDGTYTTCDSVNNLSSPTYTFPSNLIADTIYYWKVRRNDYYEGTERWSNQLYWWFRTYDPVSIELTAFNAVSHSGGIILSWRTESENDNMEWRIERSAGSGADFVAIGTVPGQGTKPGPTDYTFSDTDVFERGRYYYRLGDRNSSGLTTWHGPIAVDFSTTPNEHFTVLPKSASRIEVAYTINEPTIADIAVYDISGRVVATLFYGKRERGSYTQLWNGISRNGTAVPAGIYFCRMRTDTDTKTVKFVYMR